MSLRKRLMWLVCSSVVALVLCDHARATRTAPNPGHRIVAIPAGSL